MKQIVRIIDIIRTMVQVMLFSLCHGSSCDAEIDLQSSQKTMTQLTQPVKMGLN
jgi:hypothetical protein